MSTSNGLLDRLARGPVVGDGSFVVTLEKRGYVLAGSWTPESVVQYPDAVKQLHREFLRAGSDVMQTFTFYASDDSLKFKSASGNKEISIGWEELNNAACDLAREVAEEGDALVAGSLSPIPGYMHGKGKEFVQSEFRKQCDIFVNKKVDFLMGEFFGHVEEAEWAIEIMASTGLPVACTTRMGVGGDESGVKPADVAVRMARAGADVIGTNCCYDPDTALTTIEMMKTGLEKAGLKRYLMMQPVCYHTQEIINNPKGYFDLPEFPFAMEPRLLTRVDVHQFTRRAYDLGVRYIGGCCGFEPYHIRAVAEELSNERKKRPPGVDKHMGYESLKTSVFDSQRERANAEYWNNLIPAAGRERIHKLAPAESETS
ncbi:betaine--homocysteine S-methyltransferase 1-like [Diadema antillarum]|uniref:betaine--homocysteine S-methyltransferase 1-like n=1 Tax=Diadema antillarum TaxID=105358 RepID=UPI003A89616B